MQPNEISYSSTKIQLKLVQESTKYPKINNLLFVSDIRDVNKTNKIKQYNKSIKFNSQVCINELKNRRQKKFGSKSLTVIKATRRQEEKNMLLALKQIRFATDKHQFNKRKKRDSANKKTPEFQRFISIKLDIIKTTLKRNTWIKK